VHDNALACVCSNQEELDDVTPFASATLLMSPELHPLGAQSPVRPANANFSMMNGIEARFAVDSRSARMDRTPGLRRADVFAREKREGWDCWGDEVEKFSSARGSTESNAILMSGSARAGVRP
jgi:hypothetical protein